MASLLFTDMALKVAIVGPPLAVLYGGQEVQARILTNEWQEDKEVNAIFVASRHPFPKYLAPLNRIRYLRTLFRLPWYLISLFRAIGKADLVHIFAGSFGTFRAATAPAFMVAKLRKKKIIIHYHSGRGNEHVAGSTVTRQVLRACDSVVVPSEYLAAAFRAHGICTVVVQNVVDIDKYRYRLRDPLQPRLLCTRNLEMHYGLDVVVRAFAEVQQKFPEASLRLVGSGQRAGEIRRLVRKLGLKHVQLVGAIHPDDMPAIYDRSDIFINGSYVDCAPVSILEAFCSGLPVVTTAAGGIPYLVEHGRTGLLYPPGDWSRLAQGVIDLLSQQNLVNTVTGEARRQTVHYSWQALRPLWLKVYREACERRTLPIEENRNLSH
ncbi:MAG: glycosyltransferase family 4 protein [Candidatus Sulfotelmatobacter sp.]